MGLSQIISKETRRGGENGPGPGDKDADGEAEARKKLQSRFSGPRCLLLLF